MASEDEERISIWSVPARHLPIYYGSFVVLTGFSTVVAVVATAKATEGWTVFIIKTAATLAPMVVASAALIITVREVVAMTGVIADAIRERRREKRQREIAEAEERGRAEERRRWQERERKNRDAGYDPPNAPPAGPSR